jgi:hypothetical protein
MGNQVGCIVRNVERVPIWGYAPDGRTPLLRAAGALALKSQVRPKNGSLDILAKRDSKLGGALPYQSSGVAR